MAELFRTFLLTSAVGTALAIILTLLKPITRKYFSAGWNYYIWLVVLLVMIFPIKLNLPEKPITIQNTETINTTLKEETQTPLTETPITVQRETPPLTIQPTQLEKISFVQQIKNFISNNAVLISCIWLFGVLLLLLLRLLNYMIFLIKVHRHTEIISCSEVAQYTKRKIKTRTSEKISSPLIIGVFKPTLLLPRTALTSEQLHNILSHEMTHLNRNDLLYKWFVGFVKCLCWYNPMIYFISRQINIDCEISCDLAVVEKMNNEEKMSYIETILSLLSHNKSRAVPLTTGMASNKKILKRRFTMIRNKKTTSKLMSLLSALVAVVMLTTTVFASGVLSDIAKDDYRIELTDINGNVMELKNKPIIYYNEVYVPLREVFEKTTEYPPYISWNNGVIDIAIFRDPHEKGFIRIDTDENGKYGHIAGDSAFYRIEINSDGWISEHFHKEEFNDFLNQFDDRKNKNWGPMYEIPILVNDTTYISLKDINYMLYGFLNRWESGHCFEIGYAEYEDEEITYKIYDKNKNDITDDVEMKRIIERENTRMKTSIFDTAELFFKALYDSDIDTLKRYCTQDCIDKYITENEVFGMYKASVLKMGKYENDNTKLDADVKINNSSDISEISIYFKCDTDGRYLINNFGR